MNLIDFAVISKGFDFVDKIKLILFAAKAKPNTYIILKINPKNLGEKYQFEHTLKKSKVIFSASRQKGYEEIKNIKGNSINWEMAGIWVGYDLFGSKKDKKDFLKYKKLLKRHQDVWAHRLAGKLYGYPKCCVEKYIKEMPGYIKKNYSYYEFYKRLHEDDWRFPFVFHMPCSSKCRATIALNKKNSNVVKKHALKLWQEYRKKKVFDSDMIVDEESDILANGKTIWPEKDGHDYSVILKKPYKGKYYLISYLSKKFYERGTVLSGKVTMQYHYARISVKKTKGIIKGLHHERHLPMIGRKY